MYISLKEATKYCNYSQDYLKLRARQGKLKAIKIGRNWVTTRTWLQDYLNKISQPWAFKLTRAKFNSARKMCLARPDIKPGRLTFVKPNLALKIVLVFLVLGLLIAGGIFISHHFYDAGFSFQWKYSVDIFKVYFQWVRVQILDLSDVFQLEKIIPGRVIEIK